MAHPYIRLKHQSVAPCPTCDKTFRTRELRQKFCSVPCKTMAMRKTEDKTCCKCKQIKPWSEFVMRPNSRTRPQSCTQCYTPRKPKAAKPKLLQGKSPCAWCKQPYKLAGPPSLVHRRKYCSKTCADNGLRDNERTCQVCARKKHYTEFAYCASAKARQKTCEKCLSERARVREQQLGFMQTLGRMRLMARNAASKGRVPYTLTHEHENDVYQEACVLCGAPGCVMRRMFPELGFVPENVEPLCWLCSQAGTTRTGVLTDEVIIKHARAIVRWAER